MSYLEQLNTDKANKIVSGSTCLDAKYGCPAALKEYIYKEGLIKALNWPMTKDCGKTLDKFAIFLTECQHAASSLKATNILDYSENIRSLMAKLPFYLYNKLHFNISLTL